MSRRVRNILLASVALFVGGGLYVCFRSTTHIAVFFRSIPNFPLVFHNYSCDFFAFYFPDFLWAFSLCCTLNAIHLPRRTGTLLCGATAFFMGVLWEILQYANVISGTGDLMDILTYLLAAVLSTIINLGGRKHEKT